ncbi:retrovirus-related pol polyprotein from transposon TNT 1-94 [Tanacetum coccineum]
MEAIRFINTSVDEIGIDDSSRYPPDEFLHEANPSRQYQENSDISYYITSHNCSHTELTKDTHVPEVITQNEQNIPHTENVEGVEELKHPGWVDAMQEELNQFYRNKVWTLVLLPKGKIAISSKWVFRNQKDKLGNVTRNNARLVAQGYSQEERIGNDETFVPVARMEAIIFLILFPTYVYVQDIMDQSNESHLIVVKRIFRLCWLQHGQKKHLRCLSNAWRQISMLECKETAVSAMSFVEAEYVVVAGCCANILWMESQLNDYDIHYKMVPIFYDNTSAIAIANNPILHSRTKHIDIRYHFIRDHILKGDIELHFIPTEYQLADIFTKPLDVPTFTRLKAKLGMLNID